MAKTKVKTVPQGVLGYVRVSTEEQAGSGLGMAAQRSAIASECKRRGLPAPTFYEDAGLSGKNLARPALSDALGVLSGGGAAVLMVAKLDRLTRSVSDAANLMVRADKEGWGLVALDVAVDTTTPSGAAMAQMMAVFSELERKLIGQRTKDALAIKKAQGVQLGRPRSLDPDIRHRIVRAHDNGDSFAAIARALNEDGVPTAQGGRAWYAATVRQVVLAKRTADGTTPAPINVIVAEFPKPPDQMSDDEVRAWADGFFDAIDDRPPESD